MATVEMGGMMKTNMVALLQLTVGVGLAVLAQICWGVESDLPIWRMFAGWALMVTALICWNQTASRSPHRHSQRSTA